MSKKEILLQKIKNAPRNVRIDDLVDLMVAYDFVPKETRHGYLFKHDKLKGKVLPHVAKPHGREKKVLVTYVSKCINAIELLEQGDKE